jgi:hypothetical protein
VYKTLIILSFLLFQTGLAFCQSDNVNVKGRFNTDSVRLGEPIEYILSVKYPSELQVLLPDSTYNFAPFEYQKKILFATRTKNNISTDSIVYILNTFEIDSIQTLTLPVYVTHNKDCTQYFSNTDSVLFTSLVKQMPDSVSAEQLPLKINTAYNPVSWLFNYPLFSIIIGILIVLAVATWLIFGKRIKRYLKVKRLNKKHLAFLQDFDNTVEKLKAGFSPEHAEQTLVVWKRYMEELLNAPYTKATTRELKEIEKNENLNLSLSIIDRSIYGRIAPDSIDSFQFLKEFSQLKYTNKLEEIKHG